MTDKFAKKIIQAIERGGPAGIIVFMLVMASLGLVGMWAVLGEAP